MHRVRQAASRQGGYTLIELSVVLVIIGIMLLFVVGRIDGMLPRYRTRASIRELASEMRLARASAMSTGMPHYIQYDVPGRKYWILSPEVVKKVADDEVAPDTAEEAFKEAEYTWVKSMEKALPDGVNFEKILWSADQVADQMPVTVECTPYGSVRRHTIWVTGVEDQSKFTVTVSPVTGFVELKEGHVEPAALEESQE
ncbi:MAG: prepilin-type N-terminal cleavage/methylation domain-containing protein [Planctomycetes bacterium]|nr:prepilin-type N-terminal cleavage/methylation domain-containing protein [Planctomycetota bacterium]